MSTILTADISMIFICSLVFMLIFVFISFVICIHATDSVRLSIIPNLYLIFDLYYCANIFIRVVSESMVVLVLVQIFVLMHWY